MDFKVFCISFAEDIPVEPVFEVLIDETDMVVYPGRDAELTCSAKTEVEIDRIQWTREGADLPPGKAGLHTVLCTYTSIFTLKY